MRVGPAKGFTNLFDRFKHCLLCQDWTLETLEAVAAMKGDKVNGMGEMQEQKDDLDGIEEELNSKSRDYSSVMEMGDSLAEHLTPEEQSAVKNDLARLKADWKSLGESVTTLGSSLDASLQQFAEFTNLQEKLTR